MGTADWSEAALSASDLGLIVGCAIMIAAFLPILAVQLRRPVQADRAFADPGPGIAFATRRSSERGPVFGTRYALPLTERARTVAILPFSDKTPHPEHSGVLDSLADDLAIHLTRKQTVMGRTVRFERGPVETSGTLHPVDAEFLLDGSMEIIKSAPVDALRIDVQLIECATGGRVFAQVFEGPVRSIGGLEDDIAESVAGAVAGIAHVLSPAPEAARGTPSQAAWALVHSVDRILADGLAVHRFDRCIRALTHACRIDPRYAEAKRDLARYLSLRALMLGSLQPQEDLVLAEAALKASLALIPDSPELFLSEGVFALAENRPVDAKRHLARALSLDPDLTEAGLYAALAEIYEGGGKSPASQIERALAKTQSKGVLNLGQFLMGLAHARAGDPQTAESVLRGEGVGTFHMSRFLRSLILSALDNNAEAQPLMDLTRRDTPWITRDALQEWIERISTKSSVQDAWLASLDDLWPEV